MDHEMYYHKYTMPLDSNFGNQIFYSRVVWNRKFAWIPHRCQLSNKIIWLEMGYCGTAIYTGPGMPISEHRWHHDDHHLIWVLKK